jgi:adenylate cyclase class 2
MPQEIEIKLKIDDLAAFQQSLSRLKAKPVFRGSGRIHEVNVIFDSPRGRLAKKAQLLRIRTETPVGQGRAQGGKQADDQSECGPTRAVLTFKRPLSAQDPNALNLAEQRSPEMPGEKSATHKVRDEIETVVTDVTTLAAIFEGIGMRGWFRYEKYRTTYRLSARWAKGLLIEVDETPIGNFAELEGPPKKIDRAARELGFSKADYILKNYLTLYREHCRRRAVKPGNMLFPNNRRAAMKKNRKKSIKNSFSS